MKCGRAHLGNARAQVLLIGQRGRARRVLGLHVKRRVPFLRSRQAPQALCIQHVVR